MGLSIIFEYKDESFELWQSTYSTFYQFKCSVAKALGYGEYAMFRYCNTEGRGIIRELMKSEAMQAFFWHSECEGFWSSHECGLILDTLRTEWGEERINKLITGLKECVSKGYTPEFC